MTQTAPLFRQSRRLLLLAAALLAAVALLGGLKVSAATTTVTTDDGTFTISYGGYGYNKFEAPTVTGYSGSESDVTLPTTATINGEETAVTILGTAFQKNTAITSVAIPEGYTKIDISALSGCTGLTSVSIPGSLQMIGATAFGDCTSLTTVTFAENADGALKFMNKVFSGCTALESITLPVQTTSVYDDGNIFTGCTALKNITVSSGNAKYMTEGGSLYAKNGDGTALTLCTYVNAPAELTIPAAAGGLPVTAIGPMAFQKNTALTAVTIPAGVSTIGRLAFDSCANLKTVTLLGETAPELGSYAFSDLAAESTIYVANETVAAAFTSSNYTAANTTIQVGAPETPAADAAATVSIAVGAAAQGSVQFDLYLDSASEISVAALNLTLDAGKAASVSVSGVNAAFDVTQSDYTAASGRLIVYFGTTGSGNFSCTERTKLATVTVTLAEGARGSLTAAISGAKVSNTDKQADAAISAASAAARILSYDVNGDGELDLRDIAVAQRHYQASSADEGWADAASADVNGDGVVDVNDCIALFRAVIAAMGW